MNYFNTEHLQILNIFFKRIKTMHQSHCQGAAWAGGSLGAGRSRGSPGAVRTVHWKWGFLATQERHNPKSWIGTLFVVDGVKTLNKEIISTPKSNRENGESKTKQEMILVGVTLVSERTASSCCRVYL